MNHREFGDGMARVYLNEGLDPHLQAEMNTHASACRICRAELDRLGVRSVQEHINKVAAWYADLESSEIPFEPFVPKRQEFAGSLWFPNPPFESASDK